MKRIALLLLVVSGFASSCKQTGPDAITPAVDARDRMVGTYDLGYVISIAIPSANFVVNESYTGTATVSKATAANELTLELNLPSGRETLNATLTDSTYRVTNKTTEEIRLNGQGVTGQYTATGRFIREDGVQKMTYVGVSESVGIRKTTSMTGTKK